MTYAKPTEARLIDQRARRRATQALIEKYRDEFGTLYEMHRRAAEVEAGVLAEVSSEHRESRHATPEPPRLMPGRRLPGEDATDRIDVARCPHCVKHHDRGHVCTKCGAHPVALARSGVSPDLVRALAAEGKSDRQIADETHLTTATVRKVLDGRVASA